MKAWITRSSYGTLKMHFVEPRKVEYGDAPFEDKCTLFDSECCNIIARKFREPSELYPEVNFENSPLEVEIIDKSTLDTLYKGLDRYENFLGMVACMRKAQKEANDMIAQAECYEEAIEHIKKAEELEQMVDKWLEGEAL